jgi:hypothetical protein
MCISRFEKLHHGVGFGRTIINGVMRKDDTLDKNHSLFFLGLNANAIVDKDGTRRWSGTDKKLFLVWSRMHRFFVCLMFHGLKKADRFRFAPRGRKNQARRSCEGCPDEDLGLFN